MQLYEKYLHHYFIIVIGSFTKQKSMCRRTKKYLMHGLIIDISEQTA
jgi:hypothetical protein